MVQKIGNRYRRVVPFKGKTPKRAKAMPQAFYTNAHTHGCARCNLRILLCSCGTPERDPLCSMCEFGRNPPWWPEDGLPKDCCRAHSEVLSKQVRTQYLLAGKGREWWGCPVCGRKHPHDPRDPNDDPPTDVDEWQMRFDEPLPVYVWPHERT